MAFPRRSTAPTHAWIAPLVIASGVLVGRSLSSPSVRRSPEPAEEASGGGERVDGERRSGVDHQLVPRGGAVGGDERGPAVGAQLLRIAVAVHHAELLGKGADHGEGDAGALAGARDLALHLVAGHVGSDRHVHRQHRTQRFVEVGRLPRRHRAVCGPSARTVHAPFDAGVSRVDREH